MKNAIVILSLLFFCQANAQEVAPSSGGHFSSESYQLSWTVGEPVIETCNSASSQLTQGMHQSKLIVTAINEIEGLNLSIVAYPNPVTDYVQLEVDSYRDEGLCYSLHGMGGNLLAHGKLTGNRAKVPMDRYTPSAYLLKIVDSNKVLKTFKIIKQN